MMKAPITLTFVILMCSSLNAAPRSGLIQRLPADGTWVKYRVNHVSIQPFRKPRESTMTLRSVGSETRNGEKCRWIEFQRDTNNQEKTSRVVMKVLVRECHFAKAAKSKLQFVDAWAKLNAADPYQIQDLTNIASKEFGWYVGAAFEGRQSDEDEPRTIETRKGQLKISTTISGIIPIDAGNRNRVQGTERLIGQSIWPHARVPFGTAILELHFMIKDNKVAKAISDTTFTVIDYGKGARSAIPDRK